MPAKKQLTKAEAIQAMADGKKVSHRYFESDEYIYTADGEVYDEGDIMLSDFWKWRTRKVWDGGWYIFKERKQKTSC